MHMFNDLGYRLALSCYLITRIALRVVFLGSKERRNTFLNKHSIRPSTFLFRTNLITKNGITAYARRSSDDYELLFVPREPSIQKHISSISNGEVFVDVGANVGYYALKVKQANPNSEVIAIEAHPKTFNALLRNVMVNKFNIICINKAVYKSKGKITFYDHGGWSGIASIYRKSEKALTVESDTLDGIISSLGICPDFIKMDIEGAEVDALQGAHESLKHARMVIIEIHNENLESIKQMLKNVGFRISIENNGEYVIGMRTTSQQ